MTNGSIFWKCGTFINVIFLYSVNSQFGSCANIFVAFDLKVITNELLELCI